MHPPPFFKKLADSVENTGMGYPRHITGQKDLYINIKIDKLYKLSYYKNNIPIQLPFKNWIMKNKNLLIRLGIALLTGITMVVVYSAGYSRGSGMTPTAPERYSSSSITSRF